MKILGFDVNGKKVIGAVSLFTAGTIAAVMGKSKLQDSVTKIEDKKDEDPTVEIEDAELKEVAAEEIADDSDEELEDVELIEED